VCAVPALSLCFGFNQLITQFKHYQGICVTYGGRSMLASLSTSTSHAVSSLWAQGSKLLAFVSWFLDPSFRQVGNTYPECSPGGARTIWFCGHGSDEARSQRQSWNDQGDALRHFCVEFQY
jgi:hypothetical protein